MPSTTIKSYSGWVLVLPKPKKPFPGKVSRVGKGANETLGTATVRAFPMCKGYSHNLESKPNNFCAPVREPKFEKWKVWWLKVSWDMSPETS